MGSRSKWYFDGGWGLTLTVRDMAKFAQMYLNEGIHNGKQILSKSWIKESTEMNPNQYGYLWWLREEDGIFSYCAMGDGEYDLLYSEAGFGCSNCF